MICSDTDYHIANIFTHLSILCSQTTSEISVANNITNLICIYGNQVQGNTSTEHTEGR